MAKTKTTYTGKDVMEFITSTVDREQKIADSIQLVQLMEKWSGSPAKMWGPTIIGFGNYHYRYESGHEGDAPVIGFSPRKAAISLYVFAPTEKSKSLLKDLGNFRMGKSCIYVKRLSDIQIPILKALSQESIKYLRERYPVTLGP